MGRTCNKINRKIKLTLLCNVHLNYIHKPCSSGNLLWTHTFKNNTGDYPMGILPLHGENISDAKKILKIMKQVPLRTPTKPIYTELNILPVPCIYILETVSFIHKNHMSFENNSNFHN
jgi:hypothetical protein